MSKKEKNIPDHRGNYTNAEIGALAHLYRGEVYRSTLWRSRLDTTTNWSVVSLGIALSVTFSSSGASSVPLILIGFLIIFFLLLEARRYRYFNVWRARARWLETNFYAPMLVDGDLHPETHWQDVLAQDYHKPVYHISYMRALGRRLRRNYIWIFLIQAIAYFGKLIVHPTPITNFSEIWDRAQVGPIPGELMILSVVIFNGVWVGLAMSTLYYDRIKHKGEKNTVAMG